jgi:hypothetical protein
LQIGRALGNLVRQEQVKITFKIILGLIGLVVLVSFFYAEESWRGKHAWENCKRELEAKGEILDWNKFIPPPLSDKQNIFKSPKISEWFVKPPADESPTNELVARLNSILSESNTVVIADLTIEPPSTNQITKGDIISHTANTPKCSSHSRRNSSRKFRTTSSAASRYIIAARRMENFCSTPSAGMKRTMMD